MSRASYMRVAPALLSTLVLTHCLVVGAQDERTGSADQSRTGDTSDQSSCVRNDPAGRSCDQGEDCMVSCRCSGGSVDSGACVNWSCASADSACTEACNNMGRGNYLGDFCALTPTNSSNNTSDSGKSIGATCTFNSECSLGACLFAPGASYGYCTQTCTDWTDCPTYWDCSEVSNASARYCQQ